MHIRISRDGGVEIRELDDFRRFSIRPDFGRDEKSLLRAVDSRIEFTSDNQAWVEASLVQDRAGWASGDAASAGFERMIEKARPHGWIRDNPLSIAAHIEWPQA